MAMPSKLKTLLVAITQEFRQRYYLYCLLEEIKSDPQRLDDLGLTFGELKMMLTRDQRNNSPLPAVQDKEESGRNECQTQ
jgi:hypothetical protein